MTFTLLFAELVAYECCCSDFWSHRSHAPLRGPHWYPHRPQLAIKYLSQSLILEMEISFQSLLLQMQRFVQFIIFNLRPEASQSVWGTDHAKLNMLNRTISRLTMTYPSNVISAEAAAASANMIEWCGGAPKISHLFCPSTCPIFCKYRGYIIDTWKSIMFDSLHLRLGCCELLSDPWDRWSIEHAVRA